MRFQKQTTPPPWLNRSDQYRMLGMLSLLMLVLLAIDAARHPENWNWLATMSRPPGDEEVSGLREIDFTVKAPGSGLPPDAFIALAETPEVEPEVNVDIRQVPRDKLQGIEDRRLGRLRSEDEAMAHVLAQVRQYSAKELSAAARRDVGFRVINDEPDKFRGELLTIAGVLWRLERWSYGDPQDDADDLYQAWMFTDDSGNNPWVVLLSDKPAGLETGSEINRRASVAGYFFKRYAYQTAAGLHVAPMLIGRSLDVLPTVEAAKQESHEITYYVLTIMGVVTAIFIAVIVCFLIGDRKYRHSHTAEIAESRRDASPDAIEALNDLPTSDPAETFRRLSEDEKDEA